MASSRRESRDNNSAFLAIDLAIDEGYRIRYPQK